MKHIFVTLCSYNYYYDDDVMTLYTHDCIVYKFYALLNHCTLGYTWGLD